MADFIDYPRLFKDAVNFSHFSYDSTTNEEALENLDIITSKAKEPKLLAYANVLKAKLLLRQENYLEAVDSAFAAFISIPELSWASYYWLLANHQTRVDQRATVQEQGIWLDGLEGAIHRHDGYAFELLIGLPKAFSSGNFGPQEIAKREIIGLYHSYANPGIDYSLNFRAVGGGLRIDPVHVLCHLKQVRDPLLKQKTAVEVFLHLKLYAVRQICLKKEIEKHLELFRYAGHYIYRSTNLSGLNWDKVIEEALAILMQPGYSLPNTFLSREVTNLVDQLQDKIINLAKLKKAKTVIYNEISRSLETRKTTNLDLAPNQLEVIYHHIMDVQEVAIIGIPL